MSASLPPAASLPPSDYVIIGGTGDLITLDAKQGKLVVDANLDARSALGVSNLPAQRGFARSLFVGLRQQAKRAEQGGGLNLLELSQ